MYTVEELGFKSAGIVDSVQEWDQTY